MATTQKNPLLRIKPVGLILQQSEDKEHGLKRTLRPVSCLPFIPILSVLASLVLIVSLPWITLVRFAVWLVIGLVIYFLYSRRRSHLELEPTKIHEADIAGEDK